MQAGTKKYSASFTIEGKRIRRSLGVEDKDIARRKANAIYNEMTYRNKIGINIESKIVNQLLPLFFNDVPYTRHNSHVWTRYVPEFFGKLHVDQITSKTLSDYEKWRNSYWITGPGKNIKSIEIKYKTGTRLRRVSDVFRKEPSVGSRNIDRKQISKFFTWLIKNGYILKRPEYHSKLDGICSRPDFNEYEIREISEYIQTKIDTSENKKSAFKWKAYHAFHLFMCSTGCRPTEVGNIKWSDIRGYKIDSNSNDCRKISIFVHGKSKQRVLIPSSDIIIALNKSKEVFEEAYGREPTRNDYLLITIHGKKRTTFFFEEFNEITNDLNIKYDNVGNKRTSYSYRHTAITRALRAGIPIHIVAKNMGTSVQMIQKVYDHSVSEDYRDILQSV